MTKKNAVTKCRFHTPMISWLVTRTHCWSYSSRTSERVWLRHYLHNGYREWCKRFQHRTFHTYLTTPNSTKPLIIRTWQVSKTTPDYHNRKLLKSGHQNHRKPRDVRNSKYRNVSETMHIILYRSVSPSRKLKRLWSCQTLTGHTVRSTVF